MCISMAAYGLLYCIPFAVGSKAFNSIVLEMCASRSDERGASGVCSAEQNAIVQTDLLPFKLTRHRNALSLSSTYRKTGEICV